MTERPTDPIPVGQPIRCARCNHMLGIVSPGSYWSRHAGRTVLIEGLTALQVLRVWCELCKKERLIDTA